MGRCDDVHRVFEGIMPRTGDPRCRRRGMLSLACHRRWADDCEVAQGAGGVYWSEEVEVVESASGISGGSCVLALRSTCTVFCPSATTTRSVEKAPSCGERSSSNSARAVADVQARGDARAPPRSRVGRTGRRRLRGLLPSRQRPLGKDHGAGSGTGDCGFGLGPARPARRNLGRSYAPK